MASGLTRPGSSLSHEKIRATRYPPPRLVAIENAPKRRHGHAVGTAPGIAAADENVQRRKLADHL
ncbi:MAG: hypothetical protein ACREJO_09690, partial [Phycisphaerales bacterium]